MYYCLLTVLAGSRPTDGRFFFLQMGCVQAATISCVALFPMLPRWPAVLVQYVPRGHRTCLSPAVYTDQQAAGTHFCTIRLEFTCTNRIFAPRALTEMLSVMTRWPMHLRAVFGEWSMTMTTRRPPRAQRGWVAGRWHCSSLSDCIRTDHVPITLYYMRPVARAPIHLRNCGRWIPVRV